MPCSFHPPLSQLSASVSLDTVVCYSVDVGRISPVGSCAGGQGGEFFDRNPLLNPFSRLSLSLTWFLDQTHLRLRGDSANPGTEASDPSGLVSLE